MPRIHKSIVLPNEISEISPYYAQIYNQSLKAEHYDLKDIAGCGYRKSLEFLVKDYAIKNFPDKSKEIKLKTLSACINDYCDDAKLKACASRAAWLGNDETHYCRRWEGKDLQDLKVLIRLTESWILTNLLTSKYLEEMPK